MAQSTPSSIQELLSAENRASQIVADARSARTERMKEAKREAEDTIATVRGEKEKTFAASAVPTAGSAEFQQLAKETDAELSKLRNQFASNKSDVVADIVKLVTAVDLSIPETRISKAKVMGV